MKKQDFYFLDKKILLYLQYDSQKALWIKEIPTGYDARLLFIPVADDMWCGRVLSNQITSFSWVTYFIADFHLNVFFLNMQKGICSFFIDTQNFINYFKNKIN